MATRARTRQNMRAAQANMRAGRLQGRSASTMRSRNNYTANQYRASGKYGG